MIQKENMGDFSPEAERCVDDLARLIDKFRKVYRKSGSFVLAGSATFSPEELLSCRGALVTLFSEIDLSYILVESGVPISNSFGGETFRIIKAGILPYVYAERDIRVVIKRIFPHRRDAELFSAIMDAYGTDWICEHAALILPDTATIQTRLENAAKVISYRIAAIGIEEEMAIRAGREDSLMTPFLEQNREINELLVSLDRGDRVKAAEDYAQAVVMLHQCQDNLKRLDRAAAENGTSLRQTFLLNKSKLLIDRLLLIITLVHEIEEEHMVSGFCRLIADSISHELKPKKLRDFLSRNVQMIAYRITEHKRMTGEHYITSGRSEYLSMFASACGGGFIVSFLVIIKLMLHHAGLPPLWEGLAYSLNYAAGFVAVQLLGFTIATKQPAMTAAYIAASLDGTTQGEEHHSRFASVIASVSRSQLVSFAGNLLVVFPCSLLWIMLVSILGGSHLLTPPVAHHILTDVSPIFSLSVMYAAFAGAYLFLAGLISGFGDNKVIVSRISVRLLHHPWLSRHIRPGKLIRLTSYLEHNLGGLFGNISVGVMLGMTGFFGHITGLPLDIRHVTFSMGNFALGLYGTRFHITAMALLDCLSGIALIGVVNFMVSFWLALSVAMRSRGLYLSNYPDLLRSVFRYFRHHPLEFFWPRKVEPVDAAVIAEVDKIETS